MRAGDGNRTRVPSLGSSCSASELRPRAAARLLLGYRGLPLGIRGDHLGTTDGRGGRLPVPRPHLELQPSVAGCVRPPAGGPVAPRHRRTRFHRRAVRGWRGCSRSSPCVPARPAAREPPAGSMNGLGSPWCSRVNYAAVSRSHYRLSGMVLSDRSIREALAAGHIAIDPFDDELYPALVGRSARGPVLPALP